MKSIISLLLLLSIWSTFLACNQSPKDNNSKSEQTAEVYTCPMHPEVESNKPEKCPKCDMDLVKKNELNHADSSSNTHDEIK